MTSDAEEDVVRVLIADDDVPTRVGLHTILSTAGGISVVGEATTGSEACELAASLQPDVILMDVRMPDIDGIEATHRIIQASSSSSPPRRPPSVLVLTTFDLDDYAYAAMYAGASGFLLKRTPAEDLIDAVRAAAEESALPTPGPTVGLIRRLAARADPSSVPTGGGQVVRAPAASSSIESLTAREQDVLQLIARGYSNAEIAAELVVSMETVRTHVKHIYAKCGLAGRAHAVIVAYESGLVSPAE
jgi:DNA-binding NarL/FixJ family response regulator